MSLGIGLGDEVIVPAFTFFSTASCVSRVGARPVFADIERDTFNIDASSLPTKSTRGIVPVDLFGQVENMEQLLPAADFLVEDAAQAILAERDGERAGSFGAVSILSFYPTKNLNAAGDAGMLLMDDEELAARARRLRSHGADTTYFHKEIGIVSRMATIQAAILLVKLPYIATWTNQRIAIAAVYNRLFADVPQIVRPVVAAGNKHVYHQYTIRVLDGKRDALRDHLKESGIGSGVYYPLPLHLQPCFADLGGKPGDLPESERASNEVLSLPVHERITEEQQIRVVETIRKFLA